jgi:hypothetical protein
LQADKKLQINLLTLFVNQTCWSRAISWKIGIAARTKVTKDNLPRIDYGIFHQPSLFPSLSNKVGTEVARDYSFRFSFDVMALILRKSGTSILKLMLREISCMKEQKFHDIVHSL